MLDYGFEENLDYMVFHKNMKNLKPLGGRPSKDYFLSIETAKEISMLQRTEKGKEARRYFIECDYNSYSIAIVELKKASKRYPPRSLSQKYNHKHI